jgi:hypothetical protein
VDDSRSPGPDLIPRPPESPGTFGIRLHVTGPSPHALEICNNIRSVVRGCNANSLHVGRENIKSVADCILIANMSGCRCRWCSGSVLVIVPTVRGFKSGRRR